jgi:alkylhydroperoxidase family enzyme
MRLSKPRIPPVTDAEATEAQRELMAPFTREGASPDHVFRTMAQHPELFRRWSVFANHVLFKQTLVFRDREILILRIGALCRSGYEWAQHVQVGRRARLSDDEIARIAVGSTAEGWSDKDRALLRAAEELYEDTFISDATWAELAQHYSREQLVDVVFTVGQYNLVSMALNTFGVQLDERFHEDKLAAHGLDAKR